MIPRNEDLLYKQHGGIALHGIMISHSWHEIGAVMQVINEYKIDLFVEIGFHRGGLGVLLVPHCLYDPKFHYMGFDIDEQITEPAFLDLAHKTPNASIFYEDETADWTVELIKGESYRAVRPMIYCDGGDKAHEFEVYSRVIPVGGFIMVHDYPKEFREEHFLGATWMERIEKDYLVENRQILFQRKT